MDYNVMYAPEQRVVPYDSPISYLGEVQRSAREMKVSRQAARYLMSAFTPKKVVLRASQPPARGAFRHDHQLN